MPSPQLHLPVRVYNALWRHLLPKHPTDETVAFMHTHQNIIDGVRGFQFIEWVPIFPSGFAYRSPYNFELTDETRGSVIKRAHDLGSSLVEFHSHIGSRPARFSLSDQIGFEDFVPHVWWRLKGRPYLAVVVTPGSFDALVWITGPQSPEYLQSIVVNRKMLQPTRLSPSPQEPSHNVEYSV